MAVKTWRDRTKLTTLTAHIKSNTVNILHKHGERLEAEMLGEMNELHAAEIIETAKRSAAQKAKLYTQVKAARRHLQQKNQEIITLRNLLSEAKTKIKINDTYHKARRKDEKAARILLDILDQWDDKGVPPDAAEPFILRTTMEDIQLEDELYRSEHDTSTDALFEDDQE